MKIAAGIHRIGDQSIVDSYLLEEDGQVTIIDATPGYYRDIPRRWQRWAGQLPTSGVAPHPRTH